jgi:hypothetical protein
MSLICDLCRHSVQKGDIIVPHVVLKEKHLHLCAECIQWCKKIIRDPNEEDGKVTFLNEYKEKMMNGR